MTEPVKAEDILPDPDPVRYAQGAAPALIVKLGKQGSKRAVVDICAALEAAYRAGQRTAESEEFARRAMLGP